MPYVPVVAIALAATLLPAHLASAQATRPDLPRVFLLRPELLAETGRRLAVDDRDLEPAYGALLRSADDALEAGPFTVMDKKAVPPSGDKHDYMSLGTYWWPDPNRPDGKPYIRRDGEVNPEVHDCDRPALAAMGEAVQTLALAYYFTKDDRYARHAARLLRVWFLDESTRMNPHLNFAQGIPGRCDGRGIGIIDTTTLLSVVDAVGLIESSPAWTNDDRQRLLAWFRQYLTWLLTSDHGLDEACQPNNHGTYYDAQVATFALFVGDADTARRTLAKPSLDRIISQIEPDGRQPLELARTKSFDYSVMNLRGFFILARLAEHVDIDLWHHQSPDGRSLRKALDWLAPFAEPDRQWPHPQLKRVNRSALLPLFRQASIVFREPRYESLIRLLDADAIAVDRVNLLFPPPGRP